MLDKLLQTEVPVFGIIVAVAGLYLLKRGISMLKTVSLKPVVGAVMILFGLTVVGASLGELNVKPEKNTEGSKVANVRFVPDQLAGAALALGMGVVVCGAATSLRGFIDE